MRAYCEVEYVRGTSHDQDPGRFIPEWKVGMKHQNINSRYDGALALTGALKAPVRVGALAGDPALARY